MEATFQKYNEDQTEAIQTIEKQFAESLKKIQRLEERFIMEEINRELYEKYITIYKQEKKELETKLEKVNIKSSNLTNEIEVALNITMNIGDSWQKSDYSTKQKIQQLVYPEGISYNKENGECRTIRINEVMKLIATISDHIQAQKKGTMNENIHQSLLVDLPDIISNHLVLNIKSLYSLKEYFQFIPII